MNLSHGEGRLSGSLKHLIEAWQRTDKEWNDQRRKEFEKEHIQELRVTLKTTIDAMAELSDTLDSVIKKCQ
jgi:DNA phosphorothioation-dependent restriction protein DptG